MYIKTTLRFLPYTSQDGQMTVHIGENAEKGEYLFIAGWSTATMEICVVVLQMLHDSEEQVSSSLPHTTTLMHK